MLPPALAWGLMARALSVVHAISFLSSAMQIHGLCGSRGISPFATTLHQIRRDFTTNYWLYFPSLFWLTGASDAALILLPISGAVAAAIAFLGMQSALGEATIFCWLANRSLDMPIGLLYPWDSLLLEAGALAMLLPVPPLLMPRGVSSTLGEVFALDAPPHPWVAFAFRLLLARVMLGFGKKKFLGTNSKHSCYIKNFLVAQPLPSPVGWLAWNLPLPLFQVALLGMFLVECVAPILLLPCGAARAASACSIAALMVGINVGGNFGYFNLLTVALCLGCLDDASSALDPLPRLDSSMSEPAIRLTICLHTAAAVLFFPFDSWCTNAFAYWPQLAIARRPLVKALLRACRLVADQRLVHAYGGAHGRVRAALPGSNRR